MNDLNSVYMVGRIENTPLMVDGVWKFNIINNEFQYDDLKKEYVKKSTTFTVSYSGGTPMKFESNSRIGINGKLAMSSNNSVFINCNTIQNLEPKEGN